MAREQWKLIWQTIANDGKVAIHESISPDQETAIQKREHMLTPHTEKRKNQIVKVWPSITWTAILLERQRRGQMRS